MNEPWPEDELRSLVRQIADACIADSMISYIATLREHGMLTPESAVVIIDEWSSAQHEAGVMTRDTLEDVRAGRVKKIPRELDAYVEQAIEERRTSLREIEIEIEDEGDVPGDVAPES